MRNFVFPHECRKLVFLGGLPVMELCIGKRLWGMAQPWGTRRLRGRLGSTVQRGGRFRTVTMYRVDGRSMYTDFDLTRSQRGSE